MSDLIPALLRMGLIAPGESPRITPLSGGVSSEICRVDARRGSFCVKRALSRLRVSAVWEVPVERNRFEVAWLRTAGRIAPQGVPEVLGDDPADGAFAMAWLEPERYPVWKSELRDGRINLETAAAVGKLASRIHAATAGDANLKAQFSTDALFHALRLDPYLLATAKARPECAAALEALVARTAATRLALVHGDVSPKNILAGPNGPVLLDAECAWYGDPAFDLAFCLTHLVLKPLWRPQWRNDYLAAFDALSSAYLQGVTWESTNAIEARAASLLPGIALARIDGKSPVEYITRDEDRQQVRDAMVPLLLNPPVTLAAVRAAWAGTFRN